MQPLLVCGARPHPAVPNHRIGFRSAAGRGAGARGSHLPLAGEPAVSAGRSRKSKGGRQPGQVCQQSEHKRSESRCRGCNECVLAQRRLYPVLPPLPAHAD